MTLLKHIAIIMDGNRRWARKQNKPSFYGHRWAMEKTIEPILDYVKSIGIPYITLWAFSTENWRRDPKEVNSLINLFREGFRKYGEKFVQKQIRLNVIGDYTAFPKDIVKLIDYYKDKTEGFTSLTATFAINYGGRDELLRAFAKINKQEPEILTKISSSNWQERKKLGNAVNKFLDTAGMPNPDLVIRTGGEKRLSGYLLWQIEYAELFFTDTLWPDFSPDELKEILEEYANRQRRFGG